MRRAIFSCSNYWASPIQVGDHHLARGLAKRGWKVAFVSSPLSPLHVFSREDLADRLASFNSGGAWDGDVWNYVPGALAVPHHRGWLFRSSWLYRNWHRLTWPPLMGKLRSNGFSSVDLLYIRDPKYGFLLKRVQSRKSVFRLADKDEGFAHYNSGYAEMERQVCSAVDMVLYTAHSLREYAISRGATRLQYFPNGVDWERFALARTGRPQEYLGLPKPIAVYVGSIEDWFDFDLVAEAARRLPAFSFVLIGPGTRAERAFKSIRNIHVLGPKPRDAVPSYLQWADIGLIPFDVKRYGPLISSINPLKLYEYLAVGLPVVASRWEELEALGAPALLYREIDQFVTALQTANNVGSRKQDYIDYARSFDWDKRVSELSQLVE